MTWSAKTLLSPVDGPMHILLKESEAARIRRTVNSAHVQYKYDASMFSRIDVFHLTRRPHEIGGPIKKMIENEGVHRRHVALQAWPITQLRTYMYIRK